MEHNIHSALRRFWSRRTRCVRSGMAQRSAQPERTSHGGHLVPCDTHPIGEWFNTSETRMLVIELRFPPQLHLNLRLTKVIECLRAGLTCYGYQSKIARKLGVSRSTICRDMARLERLHRGGLQADDEYRVRQRIERRIGEEEKTELAWVESEVIAADVQTTESAPTSVPRSSPVMSGPLLIKHPALAFARQRPGQASAASRIEVPTRTSSVMIEMSGPNLVGAKTEVRKATCVGSTTQRSIP